MVRYCLVDENGANGPVGKAMISLLIDTDDVYGLKSTPYAADEHAAAADEAATNCTNFRLLV